MSALTKETAKYHCRACLRKLNRETLDLSQFQPEDIKNFGINITTNNQLHYLLLKYVDEEICKDNELDVPQNVCIDCYDKLQTFDKFSERTFQCAEKLRIIFSNSKDETNIEFENIETFQQNERIVSPGNICEPLDTLLESSLLANKKLTTFDSIEANDAVRFEITEISGNNILQTRESAKESSDTLERKENTHHEDNIPINTIKIESQSNEEMDFSASEVAIETEFEFMDSEQPSETNIFYESLLKDMLGENNLQTNESTRTNLDVSDCREHFEDTSNTISLKNNLKNSEIDKCLPNVEESLTKNTLKCAQCNRYFLRKINLNVHVRKVHELSKRPFQCDRCDKSYKFFSGLYEHIRAIHENKLLSYSCNYSGCERIYNSFRSLRDHKRKKHSDKISAQCKNSFVCGINLDAHVRKVHEANKGPYRCGLCDKSYKFIGTLYTHIKEKHKTEVRYYTCDFSGCYRLYTSVTGMKRHQRKVHKRNTCPTETEKKEQSNNIQNYKYRITMH